MRELPPLDHLIALTDDVGVIQHAVETVPNRSTGYCTDDVARALIVTLGYRARRPADERLARMEKTYLSFLHDAQCDDGRFRNFLGYDRRWLEAVGSPDSNGRAIWALGITMGASPDSAHRRVARALLLRALGAIDGLRYLRAEAFAVLGLDAALRMTDEPRIRTALAALAADLHGAWTQYADASWCWFEDVLTYDNARLPEALLRAGAVLADERYLDAGRRSLAFYEGVVFEGERFVPIGNAGWYRRGGHRARYAQQPLEAAAMVDAELAAHTIVGDAIHLRRALVAYDWYFGRNTAGAVMVRGGGCYDGLEVDGVNRNMGAESTLAYLAAAVALARAIPSDRRSLVGR